MYRKEEGGLGPVKGWYYSVGASWRRPWFAIGYKRADGRVWRIRFRPYMWPWVLIWKE